MGDRQAEEPIPPAPCPAPAPAPGPAPGPAPPNPRRRGREDERLARENDQDDHFMELEWAEPELMMNRPENNPELLLRGREYQELLRLHRDAPVIQRRRYNEELQARLRQERDAARARFADPSIPTPGSPLTDNLPPPPRTIEELEQLEIGLHVESLRRDLARGGPERLRELDEQAETRRVLPLSRLQILEERRQVRQAEQAAQDAEDRRHWRFSQRRRSSRNPRNPNPPDPENPENPQAPNEEDPENPENPNLEGPAPQAPIPQRPWDPIPVNPTVQAPPAPPAPQAPIPQRPWDPIPVNPNVHVPPAPQAPQIPMPLYNAEPNDFLFQGPIIELDGGFARIGPRRGHQRLNPQNPVVPPPANPVVDAEQEQENFRIALDEARHRAALRLNTMRARLRGQLLEDRLREDMREAEVQLDADILEERQRRQEAAARAVPPRDPNPPAVNGIPLEDRVRLEIQQDERVMIRALLGLPPMLPAEREMRIREIHEHEVEQLRDAVRRDVERVEVPPPLPPDRLRNHEAMMEALRVQRQHHIQIQQLQREHAAQIRALQDAQMPQEEIDDIQAGFDRVIERHRREAQAAMAAHREMRMAGDWFGNLWQREQDAEEEVVVPPPRKYPRGSGFPVVCECTFDKKNPLPQSSFGAHGDLEWSVKWTSHLVNPGVLASQAVMSFSGLGDNAYKIFATHVSSESPPPPENSPDNMIVIDKNHYQIIFPCTMMVAADSANDGHILVPDIKLTLAVHNIEKIDSYTCKDQIWPNGTTWLTYKKIWSVRLDKSLIEACNPKFEILYDQIKQGIVSEKEAIALYDFLCLLYHRSFYGTQKYHEVLMNGFKLGFTDGWGQHDLTDSCLDFNTRTMLPMYHILTTQDPHERTRRDGQQSGACAIFKMKLNPSVLHLRSQMEPMPPIRGHKGQFTFYLEETTHGLLLLAAVNLQLVARQLAKMKISIFESGIATVRYTHYRIVDQKQKTIKMVAAILTPEQIKMMTTGKLSLNVQLHVMNTQATYIRNYQDEEDDSSPYMMPGVVNGWLLCEDGKKIGVCKEHVSHHSAWLEQVFYNTDFKDCGGDTVKVAEKSDVVLDVLDIIYHRCHAVHVNKLREAMELAGFLLSPVATRYFDMAVLRTNLLSTVDKVKFALTNHLDVLRYILRHPEYHSTYTFIFPKPIVDRFVACKTSNELDGGEGGRGAVLQEPMEGDVAPMDDPNVPGPAPPPLAPMDEDAPGPAPAPAPLAAASAPAEAPGPAPAPMATNAPAPPLLARIAAAALVPWVTHGPLLAPAVAPIPMGADAPIPMGADAPIPMGADAPAPAPAPAPVNGNAPGPALALVDASAPVAPNASGSAPAPLYRNAPGPAPAPVPMDAGPAPADAPGTAPMNAAPAPASAPGAAPAPAPTPADAPGPGPAPHLPVA